VTRTELDGSITVIADEYNGYGGRHWRAPARHVELTRAPGSRDPEKPTADVLSGRGADAAR
jgi:hypothetical protein